MSDHVTSSRVAKNVRFAFILAGVQLAGTLLLVLAKWRGLIDSETTTRGVMVLIGLGMAASGNRMPKSPDGPTPPSLTHAALRQDVLRVSGWALMLGGLVFAGLWAFAPRDVAQVGSIAAIGVAVTVMVANFAWRLFKFHRSSAP